MIQKHKFITVILVIALALLGWYITSNTLPHPLGSKMDYLGKADYGAYILSDDKPYSTYYYGTNLNKADLLKYFSKADYIQSTEDIGYIEHLYLSYKKTEFVVSYYLDKNSLNFKTDKKYIIGITNKNYTIAKQALR